MVKTKKKLSKVDELRNRIEILEVKDTLRIQKKQKQKGTLLWIIGLAIVCIPCMLYSMFQHDYYFHWLYGVISGIIVLGFILKADKLLLGVKGDK